MPAPAVGVFLPSMSDAPGQVPGDMAATARHAEEVGLESVWVVDQLIAGAGSPLFDSGMALAVAATATRRVKLGYGVMILPLRPVTWAAKQVATLQRLSGDRVILGVGAGGDRHDASWAAAGVPRRERGRRTDAALRVLPSLVAGKPTRLGDGPDDPVVQLAPGAAMPPVLVGGVSEVALARTVEHGEGWFSVLPPAPLAEQAARLTGLAAARGRPTPSITAGVMVAVTDDPTVPGRDDLLRLMADPRGRFEMPPEVGDSLLVSGGVAEVADRLGAYAGAGAERLVITLVSGDWRRQYELLAEVAARLG